MSHEEGCDRDWAVLTKRAVGLSGKVEALECVRVEWVKGADGRMAMQEMPDSQFPLKADLVLLAMGFLGPRKTGMVEQARVALDPRGNVLAEHDGLSHVGQQGVRRRRHAARPVARGLGDPRRQAMRPRGRRVPDGQQHAATVIARLSEQRVPAVDHERVAGVVPRRRAHQVHRNPAEIVAARPSAASESAA